MLIPQSALIPEFERAVQKRRSIMVQVVNDEVLFSAWSGLPPGFCDTGVEFEHDVLVGSRGVAAGV